MGDYFLGGSWTVGLASAAYTEAKKTKSRKSCYSIQRRACLERKQTCNDRYILTQLLKNALVFFFFLVYLCNWATVTTGGRHSPLQPKNVPRRPLSVTTSPSLRHPDFVILGVCLFWTLCVKGIPPDVVFGVWLLSLSIMFSGLAHISARVRTSFPFVTAAPLSAFVQSAAGRPSDHLRLYLILGFCPQYL